MVATMTAASGFSPALRHLMSKNFPPRDRAETGFGDDIVAKLHRSLGGDHRIAAMGDIGKRPAMHQRRIVFERLHQIGLHRILEKHRHGAVGLEVARIDGRTIGAIADDDIAEPLFEIGKIRCKAEDRHDFGGDGDIKTALARKTVRHAAERGDERAQRPVVHVHHPPPGDAARIDIERIAPIDMVVDHRREQIMGRRDRMEIAGEMEVDILHRHDLRIATAGSPALDAEARPERRLAHADDGLLADQIEPVAETDSGRRLALAGRVGLMAVTRISLPSRRSDSEEMKS